MRLLITLAAATLVACVPVDPTDGVFACHSNSDCSPGFICASDAFCRVHDVGSPDAGRADAAAPDAGAADAGGLDVGDAGGGDADGGDADAGLVVCSDPDPEANCTCAVRAACAVDATRWACTPQHKCIRICASSSDCASDGGVQLLCDDGFCRPPVCAGDSECAGGQQCIGGACLAAITAAQVSTCTVLPADAATFQGAMTSFSIVARDSTGAVVPYGGTVTWSAALGTTTSTATTASITGGTTAGQGQVQATIGGTACAPAVVTNYAANLAGSLRIVATDEGVGMPVAGAKVVIGTNTVTTDTAGIATFTGVPAGAHTISVFADGYTYVTLVNVTSTDINVSLKANWQETSRTGSMTPEMFGGLSIPTGTMHTAAYNAALEGSWLDARQSDISSHTVPTHIDLGGNASDVDLPQGLVLGLGPQLWKSSFEVFFSGAGTHSVWVTGGNVVLGTYLNALGPVLSGGSIDPGALVRATTPFFGQLESGVLTDVTVTPLDERPLAVKLDGLYRLRASVKVPTLPQYIGEDATIKELDGVLVTGGAFDARQAFLPLGSGRAIDAHGGDGTGSADGTSDPMFPGDEVGTIALRLAPRHAGLETGSYSVLISAMPVVDLARTDLGLFGWAGAFGSPADSPPIPFVRSSIIATDVVLAGHPTPTTIDTGLAFLSVPNATINESARKLTVDGTVQGASFLRLDIGTGREPAWIVYMPGTTSSFVVPSVPAAMTDRFRLDAAGSKRPTTLLHAVSSEATYDGVVGSRGALGSLWPYMRAFSTREIARTNP